MSARRNGWQAEGHWANKCAVERLEQWRSDSNTRWSRSAKMKQLRGQFPRTNSTKSLTLEVGRG